MDPQNLTSQPQSTIPISLPLILAGFILLLLAGVGGFYLGRISNKSNIIPSPPPGKPCSMEAIQCPDGSFAGRTGPNCEFAPCPTQASQSPNQKGTKFVCPQSGWVDCMPILSEEGKKACSQEAVAWYKANCPDFKGVAK